MTALPDGAGRVAPVPPGGVGRPWRWVVAAGAAGAVVQLLTFLAVRTRLPAEIPSHYGLAGQANATTSPELFVLVAVVTEVVTALVLAAVLYFALRSGVIEHQHGPGFAPALGALLSLLALVVSVPPTLLLVGDAGYGPSGGTFDVAVGVALLLVPVVAVQMWFGRLRRGTSGAPTRTGPIEFRCSSCGESFAPSTGALVFSPHIGGSLYLACPVCGERGWDVRVGSPYLPRGSRTDPPGRTG
ncbi:MAG: DUF1648 domain-containing protein [Thermoplasmata archaeon]|nr:DUF1648 domain-containing protein [Thermoplasmata archaeon]